MNTQPQRVLVALSGGVDSSVSAALLKEQGYAVEAAFIITWQAPWLPCTWREERRDAMRVAAQLDIPFHTIDLSTEYERDVVHYLVAEYRAGRTPNPDVMCNKYVKFGAFFNWAMEQGFDYVATGHYARVREIPNPKPQAPNDDEYHYPLPPSTYNLLAGVDAGKDQTYFLWTLTAQHLAHTLFPVGGFEKSHVRELAAQFSLPTATKKDSQGVCFLGKIDMKKFLQHYIEPAPGNVLDTQGKVVGMHDGAIFFTLGQRHGFNVHAQIPDTEPLYVIAKDVAANTITVAPRHGEHSTRQQLTKTIELTDCNWIAGTSTPYTLPPTPYRARFRYRQPLIPITLNHHTDTTTIRFEKPQAYVPLGQSLVVYDGERCLGGGVIDATHTTDRVHC